MYTERLRSRWQHTSSIMAALYIVNQGKKGPKISPDQFNPMETDSGRSSHGIPLNTPEGFAALKQLASFRG